MGVTVRHRLNMSPHYLLSTLLVSTLATTVRLAFHDCVGGCDGCLNINNADNAGLADIVASLDTVYTDNGYDSVLSRADFWALAEIYAVDKTIELNNADCEEDDCEVPDSGLVFQWGRVDCNTAPYTDVDVGLPSAKLDHANVMSFFANEYYKKLVDSSLTWRHRDAGTDNWQWNVPQEVFMLNVDVALYKDITPDAVGESACDFNTCADAPTATAVEAFAASNEVWITAFTKVLTKMIAHGSTGLSDLA